MAAPFEVRIYCTAVTGLFLSNFAIWPPFAILLTIIGPLENTSSSPVSISFSFAHLICSSECNPFARLPFITFQDGQMVALAQSFAKWIHRTDLNAASTLLLWLSGLWLSEIGIWQRLISSPAWSLFSSVCCTTEPSYGRLLISSLLGFCSTSAGLSLTMSLSMANSLSVEQFCLAESSSISVLIQQGVV